MTAPAGSSATLTVAATSASGARLSYRWQSTSGRAPRWSWPNVPGDRRSTFPATLGCERATAAPLCSPTSSSTGCGDELVARRRAASRPSVGEPALHTDTVTKLPGADAWVSVERESHMAGEVNRPGPRASTTGRGTIHLERHDGRALSDSYRHTEVTGSGRGPLPSSCPRRHCR